MDNKFPPINLDAEVIIKKMMMLPSVKIDRTSFLRKELKILYPEKVINDAIDVNPAYAGISRKEIDTIAKQIINYETNKVSAISFAAGLPGGAAMAATIPLDISQYFTFILRIMQKLAYIYGFEEFELQEDSINDNTLNQIMLFLGVMFGTQGANAALKIVAETFSKKLEKDLSRKALTKGLVYPSVKHIATKRLGFDMTKSIFARNVGKIAGIGIGGALSGAITYGSFRTCSLRLMKEFQKLPLCDTSMYKNKEV